MVAVAQLVRAPDCDSGSRGFESPQSPLAGLYGFGPTRNGDYGRAECAAIFIAICCRTGRH
jgi:hypothetical protein